MLKVKVGYLVRDIKKRSDLELFDNLEKNDYIIVTHEHGPLVTVESYTANEELKAISIVNKEILKEQLSNLLLGDKLRLGRNYLFKIPTYMGQDLADYYSVNERLNTSNNSFFNSLVVNNCFEIKCFLDKNYLPLFKIYTVKYIYDSKYTPMERWVGNLEQLQKELENFNLSITVGDSRGYCKRLLTTK